MPADVAAANGKGLPYNQAASVLGIRYEHLMRLLREHRLARAADGGVDPRSVEAFRASYRPSPGFISGARAAARLGIAPRRIPTLVRAGLLTSTTIPNHNGGTLVREADLADIDMSRVAALGIKVPPPDGYVSSAEATRRLGIDRAALRDLVKSGKVQSLDWSSMNSFYLLADIEQIAARRSV